MLDKETKAIRHIALELFMCGYTKQQYSFSCSQTGIVFGKKEWAFKMEERLNFHYGKRYNLYKLDGVNSQFLESDNDFEKFREKVYEHVGRGK